MGVPSQGRDCLQPAGKPTDTDNAFVESFNGTLRDECLNVHWSHRWPTPGSRSNDGGSNTTRVGLTGFYALQFRLGGARAVTHPVNFNFNILQIALNQNDPILASGGGGRLAADVNARRAFSFKNITMKNVSTTYHVHAKL